MNRSKRNYISMGVLSSLLVIGALGLSCGILEFKNENVTLLPILYTGSDKDGESAIFAMNTDGSGQKKVFSLGSEGAGNPKRSPDGKKILFITGLYATTLGPSIYTVNADGTGLEPVHIYEPQGIPMYGYSPTWSPDGTKISFETYGFTPGWGLNNEIYVFDLEKDSLIRVTNHPAPDGNVSWSPDSKRIAFNSRRENFETDFDTSAHHIYEIDIVTLEVERLSDTPGSSPVWSPDGRRIVFKQRIKDDDVIHILDMETRTKETLNLALEDTFLFPIQWLKDGRRIVLQGNNIGFRRFYTYNIETGETRLIIESNRVREIDWYEPK